jgi:hypothetical protein
MLRHIFPNVAHLMLIVTVLEFSALILYEAVLSYVGVGVDPSMNSFGGMINMARAEMSRDPVVWWSFASAFVFMVRWCWRPTCLPTACAMPSTRAHAPSAHGRVTQKKGLPDAAPDILKSRTSRSSSMPRHRLMVRAIDGCA